MLMRIDFIGPFEKFIYGNTYIYNLIDYFLRHIYPHPTFEAGTNNVIVLFHHYLGANLKFYAIYMDTSSNFIEKNIS